MRLFYYAAFFSLALALFSSLASAQASYNKAYDPVTKTFLFKLGGNNISEMQLIENTDQCFFECTATIRLKFYVSFTMPSKSDSNFYTAFEKASSDMAGIRQSEFRFLENISWDETRTICDPYSYLAANGTSQINTNCTEKTIKKSRLEYKTGSFFGRSFMTGKDYYIQLVGYKEIKLGRNNVDWRLGMFGFENREWAWWNSSCNLRRTISIQNVNITRAIPVNTVLNITFDHATEVSQGQSQASGSDVFLVWFNTTANADQEIARYNWSFPFNNTLLGLDFRLQENISAGITDGNYSLYYNCTAGTPRNARNEVYPNDATLVAHNDLYKVNGIDAGDQNTTINGINAWPSAIRGIGANATDDYAYTFGNVISNDGKNFSMEAWVCPNWAGNDATQHNLFAIRQAGGHVLTFAKTSGNRLDFNTDSPVHSLLYDVSTAWTVNQCHHLAISLDTAAGKRLWLNGILANSSSAAAGYSTGNNNVGLGGILDATGQNWQGIIDEVYVYNTAKSGIDQFQFYGRTFPTITLAAEQSEADVAGNVTVTISYPLNTTYLVHNLTYNFTVSGSNLTYTCTRQFDATTVNLGVLNNNTARANETVQNISVGSHTLTLNCTSGTRNGTAAVTFSAIHWNATLNYTNPVLETNTTFLNLSVTTVSLFTIVNASILYNNREYNYTATENNGSIHYFRATVTVPLVQSNNSNVSFNWTIRLTYSNSSQVNDTTSSANNTVRLAYFIDTFTVSPRNLTELDSFNATTILARTLTFANMSVNVSFNGSFYSIDNQSLTYSRLITTSQIAETNLTFAIRSLAYFNFQGNTRQVNGSEINITVYNISITDCTAASQSTTETMNLSIFDEESLQPLIASLEINLDLWRGTNNITSVSTNFSNGTSYRLCIYPAFTSYLSNVTIQYYNTSTHPDRNYYLVNTNLSNSSTRVNLYLLNDAIDTITNIRVIDGNQKGQQDIVVEFLRYYIPTNSYRTVAMVKTDFDGNGITRLRGTIAFYKFNATRDGQTVKQFSATQVAVDTDTLQANFEFVISTTGAGDFFNYFGKITATCGYLNSTQLLSCTIRDPDGLLTESRFLVEQRQLLNWVTLCDISNNSFPTAASCVLNNSFNNTYRYTVFGTLGSSESVLTYGNVVFKVVPIYTLVGVLVTAMLFLLLTFAGMSGGSPSTGLMLGGLSLIVTYVLGWYTISYGALLGIILVFGIFIVRLRG